MLGVLPAVLTPCGPMCAQPFLGKNVEELAREEWEETPAFMRRNAARAHDLAERLFNDFGDRIRIEVVGLDSPKGVWLALRHHVGKGFAIVVGGGEVVRDPLAYETTRTAVERAIRASAAVQ